MRVVAGSARGLRLRGPSSEGTRPISDRAKEALFNILGTDVVDARFLDLFAGTGAVGIEALSRGAASATFVERDREAVADVRANLEHTRLADRADVVAADVFRWLEGGRGPYDLVFSGPPQWQELWSQSLTAIEAAPGLLADGARVVVQLDPREEVDEPPLTRLQLDQRRAYGKVLLRFYWLA